MDAAYGGIIHHEARSSCIFIRQFLVAIAREPHFSRLLHFYAFGCRTLKSTLVTLVVREIRFDYPLYHQIYYR